MQEDTPNRRYNKNSREQQLRYLSQSARLEEAVNPRIVRMTMLMISASIIIFIGWASQAKISEIARTPGEMVPQGFQQVVQHLEGGIVKDIMVQEGQLVEQGQLLVKIDANGITNDYNRAQSTDASLAMQALRLRAFIAQTEPDFSAYEKTMPDLVSNQRAMFKSTITSRDEEALIIKEQISQKRNSINGLNAQLTAAQQNYAIVKDLYSRRVTLNKRGAASDVRVMETKQQMNEVAGQVSQLQSELNVAQDSIREFESRLKSLDARYQNEAHEELNRVEDQLAQNKQILEKVGTQIERLDVRAPVRGLVKGLEVNTIGSVIQPGQVLMEIVPLDKPLVAQVKVPPQHIGHLQVGQNVQVKFSSYDFSRYGSVPGTLTFLSPSTFTGDNGERYYQGQIKLSQSYVGKDNHNTIVPGMTVMADIITGDKTILGYLLKPIQISLKTAFTER